MVVGKDDLDNEERSQIRFALANARYYLVASGFHHLIS